MRFSPHLRLVAVIALLLLTRLPAKSGLGLNGGQTDTYPLLYTISKTYDANAWKRGEDRFRDGAQIVLDSGTEHHILFPHFYASADPAVSFDGKSILFAGKQSGTDPWQIWESPIDQPEPHHILDVPEDCVRPLYLPGDEMVYARKTRGRYALEKASLKSPASILPLTYSDANALPDDVLRDGRILFSSVFPAAKSFVELYTVYSDGSGVESYRCDHAHDRFLARQLTSGDIVFALDNGLARFTSALAHEVKIAAPSGEYAGDVVEEQSSSWLVPWRPTPQDFFILKQWAPGSSSLRTRASVKDKNVTQPTRIAPRIVPNRHPSGLHDWPNANLLCLNAYTSPYKLAPGSIHAVRVNRQDPSGHPVSLGEAPVEPDGSFFVQIPSDQPVQVDLLDAQGNVIKRENGWFWMRRGEQRVCVGCHSGPQTSPENAVPAVLVHSTTPVNLTGTPLSIGGN